MSICLTKGEISELTLKKRHSAQVRVLAKMGIRYTLRPDGSPVVLRSDLVQTSTTVTTPEPDFSSLTDGTQTA